MQWLIPFVVSGLIAGLSQGDVLTTPTSVKSAIVKQTTVNPAANGQTQNAATQERREEFNQTYPLNQNGRVSLSNLNGTVRVEAWDRAEVRVEAVKTIDCETARDIEIRVDSNSNWLRIETEYERFSYSNRRDGGNRRTEYCRKYDVDYKLTVPQGAQLDEIETVNGTIDITGLSSFVKASAVNGKLTAREIGGTVVLSTVNGGLTVDFNNLDRVEEIKLNTVNGSLTLQMPSDADADLRANTVNGTITNDFGLPVRRGEYVGRDLHGRLGDGKLPVRLSGVNGTINIRRNQDGRQTRPVTNLLPDANNERGTGNYNYNYNYSYGKRAQRTPPAPPVAPVPPVPPVAARPKVKVKPLPAPDVNVDVDVDEVIDEETRETIREAAREAQQAAREGIREAERAQREAEREARQAEREMRDAARTASIDVDKTRRETARLREFAEMERDSNRSGFEFTARQVQTFAVTGVPDVNIEALNGNVSIRGWDRAEISYALVQRQGESPSANSRSFDVDQNSRNLTLKINPAVNNYRLEVFVPRNSNLKISARAIRLEGVRGDIKLNGSPDSIDVRDSGGNIRINAASGRVRVVGFAGEADVASVGSDVMLEGDFTRLNTNSVAGTIVLTLPDNQAATINANNKVQFDGFAPQQPVANAFQYKIGAGGETKNFDLQTVGGSILVQSSSRVYVKP